MHAYKLRCTDWLNTTKYNNSRASRWLFIRALHSTHPSSLFRCLWHSISACVFVYVYVPYTPCFRHWVYCFSLFFVNLIFCLPRSNPIFFSLLYSLLLPSFILPFLLLNEKQIRACSKSYISSMWIRYYKLSNPTIHKSMQLFLCVCVSCLILCRRWANGWERKKKIIFRSKCVRVYFGLCNNWEKRTLHDSTKV